MDFPTNDNLLLVFSAGRAFFGLSIFRGHHALIFRFSKYKYKLFKKVHSCDKSRQGWPRKRACTRNGKIICHNCCPFFHAGVISSRSIDHSPSGGQIRGRVISFFNPDPINNRPTGHKVSIYRVDGIEAHPSQRSFKTIFFFLW